MVAAPRLWNSLPKELRAITYVNSFKAHIKTYLLKLYIGEQFYIQFLLACIHILYIFFYFLMHYLLFVSFKVTWL